MTVALEFKGRPRHLRRRKNSSPSGPTRQDTSFNEVSFLWSKPRRFTMGHQRLEPCSGCQSDRRADMPSPRCR